MSTSIITKAEYDIKYADKTTSGIMFVQEFWDCICYVNMPQLRKKLKLKKDQKVLRVICRHNNDPLFVNKANKFVIYNDPVCIDEGMDGAYEKEYYGCKLWMTDHPIGDVIIVQNK
jgi:hypothetical protein